MRLNRRRREMRTRQRGKRPSARGLRWPRTLEALERRELLTGNAIVAAPWHNALNPQDVNHDNRVSPMDAMLVINELLSYGIHSVPAAGASPQAAVSPQATTGIAAATRVSYVDVNGDNMISPIDAMRVINLLAVDKLMQTSVFATHLNGTPILPTEEISVGTAFLLQTVVEDKRDLPAESPQGVFAAYLNVSYDAGLVTIPDPPTFTFDDFFDSGQIYDATTPGLISGAGAFSFSHLFDPPGNAPQELWTVLVYASAPGVVTFTPSFDMTGGHDVVLYGEFEAVANEAIDFVGSSLTITAEPAIDVAPVSIEEGNSGPTPFVFTVSLSNAFNVNVTVEYNTESLGGANAATEGDDYQAISGTLTFTPGVTQRIVTVLVNGELTVEPDELFNFKLSNPINGVLGPSFVAAGTIVNDDVLAALTIEDVTVTNVTSGTTTAEFTVSLSPAATSETTVQYATAPGTAVSGVDYTGTSGTLTFIAGASTRTITVSIIGDPLPDETESFVVNLSIPSLNAFVQDSQATGTILPAVPIPNMTVSSVSLTEGNVGNKNFIFTATLSSPAPQEIHVAYSTVNGTATTANNDYIAKSDTLTFVPTQSLATFTIAVVGDSVEEPSESFSVNLSRVSGPVGTVQGITTGTIQNDDGPPTILIDDATVIGGASGTTNAVFTVTLSAAIASPITVSYATEDNSATANEDYLAQSGILTFTPTMSTLEITVPVLGSSIPGPDETFFVNLSSPSPGAIVGDAQALGTIVRQGLTIGGVSIVEGNAGTTNALFTVELSVVQDHVVTVAYNTAIGTATVANADYVPVSGSLTFAVGETSKEITVPIVGDLVPEPNETFFVNLSNASGAVVFTSQGNGTILNDDGQKVLMELELAATNGGPLPPALDVNDEFLLRAYVKDLQADWNGVAAAYLDVLYDSNLVMVTGPITYGDTFDFSQSGSTATADLIDEVGAFRDFTRPLDPTLDPMGRQLLFSIPLKALDVGLAVFGADPADVPTNQVFVYPSEVPIPPAAINYVGTSINIGANVFTVGNASTEEGDLGTTNLVFTVSRFLPSGTTARVVYSTKPGTGTATAGSDYVAQSGTLNFSASASDTTRLVTIVVNGDTTDEEDETFFVELSDPFGAVASSSPGVGTIVNDDGPVSISIAGGSGSEGGDVTLTVSLSEASGKTVTVEFNTAESLSGAIATAGADFQSTSGTMTFAPGVTQLPINVPALADLVADPNETFRVLLSHATNANISTPSAQGTIIDVPPATIAGFVYADLNNNGIKEGSEVGIGNVTVRAIRDGVVVKSALTGSDGAYSLVGLQPGTYTVAEVHPGFFIDGRDTRFGVDSLLNDQFAGVALAPSQLAGGYNFGEQGLRVEFVSIFLNRRAFFASAIVTGIYGPTHSTTGIDLRTGDAWVSLDGGWQGPRTIQALFDALAGTATMTLYNNSLVPLAVSSPAARGSPLTYSATAGQTYFLRISGTSANVSLQALDTLSINNVSHLEGSGASSFVFTASLSTPQSQPVTVNYSTLDGTAIAATGDYVATSGALTFAPGETSKLITVVVNGDAVNELDETFSVVLASPTNIALGIPAGLGTIQNDDGLFFSSTLLFASNSGGGSVAPAASVAPQAASGGTTQQQPSSPPAVQPLAATVSVAPANNSSSAADAALEEDEDWVTASLLA